MELAHIYHWCLGFCQMFEVNYPQLLTWKFLISQVVQDHNISLGLRGDRITRNDGEFSVDHII